MFESIKNFLGNLKSKGNTIISTSRASEEFILLRNDFGTVGAEVATIQKVIGRSASSVEGISSASVSVESSAKNAPLKVHFTLELEQNFSVNDVSKDLVSAVKGDLEKFFAILDVEIYVRVTDVSKPKEKVKRRVR